MSKTYKAIIIIFTLFISLLLVGCNLDDDSFHKERDRQCKTAFGDSYSWIIDSEDISFKYQVHCGNGTGEIKTINE